MRWLLPLFCLVVLCGCGNPPPAQAADQHTADQVDKMQIIDQKVGTGAEAKDGWTVTVNYTGWVYSASAPDHHGTKFDSSLDHGEPFSFMLGQGSVISGWDKGLLHMRVGGKRTLIIPASMAYGASGAGDDIPPNATLVFDIDLLKVQ